MGENAAWRGRGQRDAVRRDAMAREDGRANDRSGTAAPTRPRRIVGYYAGWTSKARHYTPADIPADRLTHVNYAFGLIDADRRAMLGDAAADIGRADPSAGGDPGGNFRQIAELKERHPH
ncbi:MAG TPA: glycosyl hydrolase family 18 protein, partial [Thermomicrobiales bacterium]|nr:glycosyl hydrolase family 18 protein [Thermomicrobiales bacterium]